MCGTCGCETNLIQIEQDLLTINNQYASLNRETFLKKQILALNLVSSPGSGKTSLLEKTIANMKQLFSMAVIEGDQQTDRDAQRIQAAGARAVQINTGKACHLDAHMINHALEELAPVDQTIVFIENVGNLVCPALFDLGENFRVVILSVTEGDDKPIKYPDMFYTADLMVINKIDLLPYVSFNTEQCIEYAKQLNPAIEVIQLSATTGVGMLNWLHWLQNRYSSILAELQLT